MNMFRNSSLEFQIIELLKDNTFSELEIRSKLGQKGIACTKQGVYKALRILIKKEIVIKVKDSFSLSKIWIEQMHNFFSDIAVTQPSKIIGYQNFKDKESITFLFNNPIHTDVFWTNAYIELLSVMKPNGTVLLYNPTEWFMFDRPQSELNLMRATIRNNQKWVILNGKDTNKILDKVTREKLYSKSPEYTKHFQPEKLPSNLFGRSNYYVNVFDDFLIEVYLDEKAQRQIASWYKTTKTICDESISKLRAVVSQRGKNKIVISRNKIKTERLKKVFEKYFVL